MSAIEDTRRLGDVDVDAVVAAATAGDASAFSELVERYQRELQAHTFRLVGSHEDSEDLTQETFLRAWRKRESFRGRSSFRTWLYRIATNATLDALTRRRARLRTPHGPAVALIQSPPDRLPEEIAMNDAGPDATLVSKETIELALLVAVQHLPPKQRAVLIARDLLGWPAKETAALLETSVASVNSALQRARATLRKQLPGRRLEWTPGLDPSEDERALLHRYLDAAEHGDANAFADILREDVRPTTPSELRRLRPVTDSADGGR